MQTLLELIDGGSGSRFPQLGFRRLPLPRGEVLFRQGDEGQSLYIVAAGRLRASRQDDGVETVLGEVGRGETVGELALLGQGRRAATIMALRDSILIEVTRERFDLVLASNPAVMRDLLRLVIERFRASLECAPPPPCAGVIALLPASVGVPLTDFAQKLSAALSLHGKTLLLERAEVPPEYTREAATAVEAGRVDGHFARWINLEETRQRFVLLSADHTATPWTRRCLRQADIIVLVGHAQDDPRPGAAELALETLGPEATRPCVYLVLLHQGDRAPANTAAWLEGRRVGLHRHLRQGVPPDLDRLARLLAGKEVAVALGGGGARGYAHLGFAQAARELGLPLDRFGGTSAGSLVGALLASGLTPDEAAQRMREEFVERGSLRDLTLPLLSIMGTRLYLKALDKLFGDRTFEDLTRPFFAVSCNLSLAESVVHRRGPLVKWVSASMSIPGIAPPLIEQGHLIVDGGVLNNLPVDIARRDAPGLIIGVDVSPREDLVLDKGMNLRPTGHHVLQNWLNPAQKTKLPSLLDVITRTASVSSILNQEANRKVADLLVEMPVGGWDVFDWDHLDTIRRAGYEHSIRVLEAWLKEHPGIVTGGAV